MLLGATGLEGLRSQHPQNQSDYGSVAFEYTACIVDSLRIVDSLTFAVCRNLVESLQWASKSRLPLRVLVEGVASSLQVDF